MKRTKPGIFGWDNEFPGDEIDVPAFSIEQYKVTNAQFARFVHAGGYKDRRFWSEPAWEWTSTLFEPFRDFEALPFYPGYSANFFDGKHYILKGGSPRTASRLLRRSFRNWFQPLYPIIYASFRCVEN